MNTLKLLMFISIILSNAYLVMFQDCSSSVDNTDYMGSRSLTQTNQTCKSWLQFATLYPTLYDAYDRNLIDGLRDSENFCRNPLGAEMKDRAWCYTDILTRAWEYCSIPKCIGCARLHGILHGTIELASVNYYEDESFQPGSLVRFKCNPYSVYDYTSGPLDRTCRNDNRWSADKLPRCLSNCWYYSSSYKYKDGAPRILYYGQVNSESKGSNCLPWESLQQFSDADFPEEGKVLASNYCRSPGNFKPSCYSSGSRQLSACQVSKCTGCAEVPFVKYSRFSVNGNLSPDNTADENTVLTYGCNRGTLVGSQSLTCQNGQWIPSPPVCSLKYCSSNPPQVENSYISFRSLFYASIEDFGKENLRYDGSVYVFLCKSIYRFEKDDVSQLIYECNNGQWVLKGAFARCVSQEGTTPASPTGQYCPIPGDVANGYRIRSSVRKAGYNEYYGDFEIACYSSFSLIGNAVVRCVNGAWTPYPKCVKAASCSLDIISTPAYNVKIISSNLVYNDDQTGLIIGSNVIYECLPGTVPEVSQDDLRVTCLPNGQWSSKIPVRCV